MRDYELIRISRPSFAQGTLRAQTLREGADSEPQVVHIAEIEPGETVELRLHHGDALAVTRLA